MMRWCVVAALASTIACRIGFDESLPTDTSAAMTIEDAPGGRGAPLGAREIRVGQTVAAFAVARNGDGTFAEDVMVTWSLAGSSAMIERGPSNATHLTFATPGSAVITAEESRYGWAMTGTIVALACGGSAECTEVCHTSATCVSGACMYGVATKDADGDGFIDIACLGGADCDDDPLACGSACAPGRVEACDGYDNDCLVQTADGVADPMLSAACDGSDADTCTDDRLECVAGSLSCSSGIDICNGAPAIAVADSYLHGTDPTPNGADPELLIGRATGGPVQMALIQFDLSAYPPGTTITSAILRLHQVASTGSGSLDIYVHRITQGWNEATVDWNTQPSNDATHWVNTVVPLGTPGAYTWDVTTLVKAWIDGTYPNDGMLLDYDTAALGTFVNFGSRENTNPAVRSDLIVTTQ